MRSIHSPGLGLSRRWSIHPAGAPGPVFTNSFLTPDEIHYGHAAEYAWEQRDAQVNQAREQWSPFTQPTAAPPLDGGQFTPRMGRPFTYAEFLSQCPTRQEVQQLLDEINLEFQPGTGVENLIKDRKLTGNFICHHEIPWVPTPGTNPVTALAGRKTETTMTTITVITKVFQTLKWLQFDKPIPIIGPKTPYEWIRSLGVFEAKNKYRIFPSYRHFLGAAPAATLLSITDLIVPAPVYVFDLLTIISLAGLILHEARHSLAGGLKIHTCNSAAYNRLFPGNVNLPGVARNDQELGDGACAMKYWFLVWCRHHTSPGTWHSDSSFENRFLSKLDQLIRYEWETLFCTHRHLLSEDPAVYGPPPLDPSDAERRSVFPEFVRPGGQLLAPSTQPTAVRMPPVQQASASQVDREPIVNKNPAYGEPLIILPEQPWMRDTAYQRSLEQKTGLPWKILEMEAMTV